jgi:hypothetical protein
MIQVKKLAFFKLAIYQKKLLAQKFLEEIIRRLKILIKMQSLCCSFDPFSCTQRFVCCMAISSEIGIVDSQKQGQGEQDRTIRTG